MTFDPNKVYGDVPSSFSHRVEYALRRCEKEEINPMKRKSFVAVLITVLCLAMATTAVAAALSKTVEFFVFEYGERVREKMESGTVAPGGQFTQLNDVVFTLSDAVVVPDQVMWTVESGDVDTPVDTLSFYATGVMSVAEEENIILLACDEYTVNDPAGYALYYPNWPKAPEGAPTYAEIAKEKDATIRMVNCVPNGIVNETDGSYYPCTPGVSIIPLADGTVHFSAELTLECENAPVLDSYQLSLYISTEDIDLQGNPIEGTRRGQDWIVTLTPEKAE
jgi:hypothetical protein